MLIHLLLIVLYEIKQMHNDQHHQDLSMHLLLNHHQYLYLSTSFLMQHLTYPLIVVMLYLVVNYLNIISYQLLM